MSHESADMKSHANGINGDNKPTVNGTANGAASSAKGGAQHSLIPQEIPSMSTSALETKLRQVRDAAQEHSQVLTQKLASSPSGQNLLHIGTSLSTLPPDLHTLLTHMHPFVNVLEGFEKDQRKALTTLVEKATAIRQDQHRVRKAERAADLYADLTSAEACLQIGEGSKDSGMKNDDEMTDDLDRAASLERSAHVTLCLVQDLHAAQDYISAWTSGADAQATASNPLQLPSMRTPSRAQENEFAQFLLKLAPRIRTLEGQTVKALGQLLEKCLQKFYSLAESEVSSVEDDLLVLGHCMRGLALLGRGKEVESVFARTAIMPMIRSLISMGRLDQGGSRGECAGLVSLLEEITTNIQKQYGRVLSLAEVTFCAGVNASKPVDVDLLSEGVWVPIATALMADAGIKMAIFSPGIASILQANYVALDNFLSGLSVRLLAPTTDAPNHEERFLYQADMTESQMELALGRVYAHQKTAEFIKKWNLPIYYQLRFGESCNRLNKAIDQTKREGWVASVFTGESDDYIREKIGLELSFFQELYDVLIGLWRRDVILPPLTNRFLRGSVQLVGRSISFVSESMEGKIKFGEEPPPKESNGDAAKEDGTGNDGNLASPPPPSFSRPPYCWGDSQDDVAAVAWELTVLESALMHEYVDTICSSMETQAEDLRPLVVEVLKEATQHIHPVIDRAWNEIIVNILTTKCSGPLAAVKGVAATYRMTNRPPPTQASHWVVTILRPLQEFSQQFTNRIPERVGSRWKQQVVVTVADRYAAAVKELLTTVERTENALRTRRTVQRRQASASTLSDGEKVKLQVYLDYQTFRQSVRQVGIDPATVIGLSQLEELTSAGVELQQRVTEGL